ncbi:MAG: hypothetical protein R3298_10730 [Gammaproteobacteria bacterium]|nr:hypothetical protein [Gammaproteobacteria bacterium]
MDKPFSAYRLGEDHEALALDSLGDNIDVVDAMASQSRRTLDLFTRDLEPRLYDREPFYQALRQLAISSRNAMIRVLIMDSDRVVKEGHKLIDLGRRLSTYVAFRKVAEDYRDLPYSFLVADVRGYLYRPLAVQYKGEADFHNPYRAKELAREFQDIWEHSSPDPNLRRLHL